MPAPDECPRANVSVNSSTSWSARPRAPPLLGEVARLGVALLFQTAIEAEVTEFHKGARESDGAESLTS